MNPASASSDRSPASGPLRIAVLGGGISGLAAAHRVTELAREQSRPVHVTVFEASSRLGGPIGTLYREGWLIELGPDMFITNQPAAVNLCERIGLKDELIPTDPTHRGSLVLRNGRPVPIPDGFMLLSPARIWPVLKSPIFSPLGKLRMGLEYFVPRGSGADESLASFVRRRFGREALDRLIQPLVGGIYTSDPERLSLKATLGRFLDMERQHRSLIVASRKQAAAGAARENFDGSGARYGLFTTLRDGMQQLVDRLVEHIGRSGLLRLNTPVTALRQLANGTFEIQTESETGSQKEQTDRVIMALPARRAAELLRTSVDAARSILPASLFDDSTSAASVPDVIAMANTVDNRAGDSADVLDTLANELSGIEYASCAIVASGHRLSDIRHPMNAFGLVIPAIERRRVLAVSFTSRKFPGRAPDGHILLRTFVGGAIQPEEYVRSDEEILATVQSELAEILGVIAPPEFATLVRYDRAMPQYHLGHADRVDRIMDLAARIPGIELCGSAYRGVGLPDCIQFAESAAERALSVSQHHTA